MSNLTRVRLGDDPLRVFRAKELAAVVPALRGAAPPNTDNAVALGQAAWARRKADVRASWEDWKLIGEALLVGRQCAMDQAHTSKPAGKKYSVHFHHWIETHGFGDIDKDDRAKLLLIMTHLDEIEAWRARRPQAERARYNYPSTIWRVSKCRKRGVLALRGDQPVSKPLIAAVDDDDESQEEIEAALLKLAHNAVKDTKLQSWILREPAAAGVVAALDEAGECFRRLALHVKDAA
jgi:hypothetical protein